MGRGLMDGRECLSCFCSMHPTFALHERIRSGRFARQMNLVTAHSEVEPTPVGGVWLHLPGRLVVLLFAGLCGAATVNQFGPFWAEPGWFYGVLVGVALLAAIGSLATVLPWPNVILAAGLAAFIGGMAEAISGATGLPFMRGEFTPEAGPLFLGLMPWWLPAMWAVIALAARGTARLALHRLRSHSHHGYRVLMLATGMAICTSIGVQEFAARSIRVWPPEAWWASGNVGYALHLVIQIAITPLLLDKFPVARPANLWPGLVLMSIVLLVLSGSLRW